MQSERRSKRTVAQVGQVGAQSTYSGFKDVWLLAHSVKLASSHAFHGCVCAASSRWPSKQLANLAIQASAVLQPKA